MQLIEVTKLGLEEKHTVFKLWNQEYPKNVSYNCITDLDRYLDQLSDKRQFLLLGSDQNIAGWAVIFTRENDRWFSILLAAKEQRQGNGTILLNKLKENEHRLCGWVVDHNNYRKQNGEQYISPMKFYEKNGFTVCSETRLETEKLSLAKIVWQK